MVQKSPGIIKLSEDLKKEWKKIAVKIRTHDKKYAKGKPLIEDFTYDILKNRLKEIEKIIGHQKNSPLNTVG